MESQSSAASATSLPHLHPIALKLDSNNYVFWRAQVLPPIRIHALDEYISSTALPPVPLLPSPPVAPALPNPEYSNWIRRDQFLLGWLLASIIDAMLGHVVCSATARDLWLTLERLFLSQSKARAMQLRMALQTTKKGAMSADEYFLKIRSIADQLSAIGQLVIDDDLQMYILVGFGIEYEALVVNFMQRADSPSSQELQLMDPSANAAFYGGARGATPQGFVVDVVSEDDNGDDQMWYMDSGATNHITNELANVTVSSDYLGKEAVMVGNGQNNTTDTAAGLPS